MVVLTKSSVQYHFCLGLGFMAVTFAESGGFISGESYKQEHETKQITTNMGIHSLKAITNRSTPIIIPLPAFDHHFLSIVGRQPITAPYPNHRSLSDLDLICGTLKNPSPIALLTCVRGASLLSAFSTCPLHFLYNSINKPSLVL